MRFLKALAGLPEHVRPVAWLYVGQVDGVPDRERCGALNGYRLSPSGRGGISGTSGAGSGHIRRLHMLRSSNGIRLKARIGPWVARTGLFGPEAMALTR